MELSPCRLNPFVAICLALFLLFWLLQLFQFLNEIRDKREIKHFYNQALRISDDRIQTMEWHEVVDRLTKVAANRRLVIVKDQLTPLGTWHFDFIFYLQNMSLHLLWCKTRCCAAHHEKAKLYDRACKSRHSLILDKIAIPWPLFILEQDARVVVCFPTTL